MPAYTFPANREDLAVLRVVVRNGFTHDLADLLLDDLRRVVPRLQERSKPTAAASATTSRGFAHDPRRRRRSGSQGAALRRLRARPGGCPRHVPAT